MNRLLATHPGWSYQILPRFGCFAICLKFDYQVKFDCQMKFTNAVAITGNVLKSPQTSTNNHKLSANDHKPPNRSALNSNHLIFL